MIFYPHFSYEINHRTLDIDDDVPSTRDFVDVQVGFIHVEKEDQGNANQVETKLVKNLKWAARKCNTNHILLHSFAHLSESKADPDFTKKLFDNAEERLRGAGYNVSQTPFGCFLNLDLRTPGLPLARIFKSF